MRGGAANELTTANLLIRLKGASPTYAGAYAPDSNRTGVPCYFGTVQKPAHAGKPWSAVKGGKFAASPSNLGTGAPQASPAPPRTSSTTACSTGSSHTSGPPEEATPQADRRRCRLDAPGAVAEERA